MEQTLAVYLPMDRRHALAMGTSLPERTRGTALFADISGFTPLTEALTHELGVRRGAEELPRQLNLVYDALIREVDRYGGSVIGFAGDAITCWFDGDPGLRATACALAMQAAMRAFAMISLPSGSTISLAMKVALASGPVRRFLVGDPRVQLIDTLAGATLSRMAAAEQMAEKGEVVLDEATAHALGEALEIQMWRTGEAGVRFAVVEGLRAPVEPLPWPEPAPDSLRLDELRPWLLPIIYERLQAGQGEFLTELRPAVALFLCFAGIDYDADPEAGHKLDAFVRWVQGVLMQYEGTLLQLTIGEKGSYLYAAFGAPIAHEDDARRAALTALALRTPPEELSFITEVQMGLTRGTMRTGAYGGSTRRTYGSLGDEVNLAARLMQHAQPGQIIASGRVQAATERLFTWEPLAEIHVRGKREPLPLFALLGQAQASMIHLTEPTYTLPMIGRAAELAALTEKMQLARQGQGQVVGITAEAGMGKSRLVAEAIRRAQAQGFTGYGGECQSYGTNTPYLAWQPLWRAFFGLEASETQEQQARQLARAISELDPLFLPRLPLLAPVLGLTLPDNELTRSFGPDMRKSSREALLVDLLKRRAHQKAILLVLEDCHWLDAASHDLLEAVGHAIWNLPVLIVLAYRPPELERLEAPRVARLPHFTLLALTELSEAEAAHLLANRLTYLHADEERPLPPRLVSQLAARAQGNPFYLEELLNYLQDQGLDPYEPEGVEALELPSSLHSLILSRIDRLSEAQKVTLKVASIIGRLFPLAWLVGYYPTLGDLAQVRRDLDALSRLDLTPLERPEPELTYLFKHIVTREVAYESLPYATRAHLHEQLAAFLEQLEPSTVKGYLDLLAYHYALSENRSKTCEYLRRAGQAAQAAFANEAALEYYQRLLPLLDDPAQQVETLIELGEILRLVGRLDSAEAPIREAVALAEAEGVLALQARCQRAMGRLLMVRGDHKASLEWMEQARRGFEVLDARAEWSLSLSEIGYLLYQLGDFSAAEAMQEQSLALGQGTLDTRDLTRVISRLGLVAYRVGDYPRAVQLFEECVGLTYTAGDRLFGSYFLSNLAMAVGVQGDLARSVALYEEALTLKREIGDQWNLATGLSNLGYTLLEMEELEAASRNLDESLLIRRELGDPLSLCETLSNLGLLALRQGNYEQAYLYYEESARLAQPAADKRLVAYALIGLAAVLMRPDRAPEDEGARAMHALRVLAAADALTQSSGSPLETLEERLYQRTLSAARSGVSEEAFSAAWAEGAALTLDEAITLAL